MGFEKTLRVLFVWIVVNICIFFLGFVCNGEFDSIGAPMEKSEQEFLFGAIQGFVGKDWNGSNLYPDPCGWTPLQGVSCDLYGDFWYVTSLNIGPFHDNSLRCDLNGEFTLNLFKLKHLKHLSIFNCFDSILHPMTIPKDNWGPLSECLESLEFRSNPGLTGRIPVAFGSLNKLQSLVIIENGLNSEIPTNFGSLMNLKRLVISENWITGRIPDSLGGLKSLLILDLSKNSLSGSLPLTFGGLTSLLKLDLSNNQLEGIVPNQIGYLKNLTLLDLSKNKLSGGWINSIQEMSSLEELVLSSNPIGGNIMSMNWSKLRQLTVLDLSNMNLTGEFPNSITGLKRLRFLILNDNNLEGEIPTQLALLPNISAIYLNGNNLTGELKFPKDFYGKMIKFCAWDNTNLCYPSSLLSLTHAPLGLKPCDEKEGTLNGSDLSRNFHSGNNGNLNHNPMSMASLGFSVTSYVRVVIWSHFLVQVVFMGMVLDLSFYLQVVFVHGIIN